MTYLTDLDKTIRGYSTGGGEVFNRGIEETNPIETFYTASCIAVIRDYVFEIVKFLILELNDGNFLKGCNKVAI